MTRKTLLALTFGALLAGSLLAADSYKIRFQPEKGLWVPYTMDVTATASIQSMMGQGQDGLPVEMHARFEDTVTDVLADGSRQLTRVFSRFQFGLGGQEQDVLKDLGDVTFTFVREPHGILTKVDDLAPTDLGFNPTNPLTYTHAMFIAIPTPEAEVRAGSEWDSAAGLKVLKGITDLKAPTKVAAITAGDPAFATINCSLHLAAAVDEQMSMPGGGEGQRFPVHIELINDTEIEQQTAVSNGMVGAWKSTGKITTIVCAQGSTNPLATIVLDPIESKVAFDQETYDQKKGNAE